MQFKLNTTNWDQKEIMLLQIVMGTFSSVFRESLRGTLLVKGLQMTKQDESVREKNKHSKR